MIDTQNLNIRSQDFGTWQSLLTDQEIRLGPEHQAQLQDMIQRWLATDPHPEDTWVKKKYGLPTLILRFDCTISNDVLRVFEIEERPQGIGTAQAMNPFFAEQLAAIRERWPNITSVETPEHALRGSDDFLWTTQVPLDQCPETGIVLVRSEPHEEEAWAFGPQSVSTIRTEGRKHYGVRLGLWHQVSDPDHLPWQGDGFVVKPLQGSKCKDVHIWPGQGAKQLGSSTRTMILGALEESRVMNCQPFYRPYTVRVDGSRYNLMMRPYFGYVPRTQEWMYMGGEWLIAPSLRLHGTSDTIFGPLT